MGCLHPRLHLLQRRRQFVLGCLALWPVVVDGEHKALLEARLGHDMEVDMVDVLRREQSQHKAWMRGAMWAYLERHLAVVLQESRSARIRPPEDIKRTCRMLYCSAPVAPTTFLIAGPMSLRYSSGMSVKTFAWSAHRPNQIQ